jgi:hypothetical protein
MRRNIAILSAVTAACCVLVALLLQTQAEALYRLGMSGVFVPDAIGLREVTTDYWTSADERSWAAWRTFLGVVLLYWPGVAFGPIGAALVNFSVLAVSGLLFYRTLEAFNLDRDALVSTTVLVLLFVAGNVYLIEVMMFPNKEIPLIALTNLYIYFLVARKSVARALVVAAVVFLFRDGYGLILAMSAVFVLFTSYTPKKWTVFLLIGLSLGLAFFPASYLKGVDHSFERNIELGPRLDLRYADFMDGPAGYYFKMLGNAMNMGMRPQVLDEAGGMFLLHVGYWQFGICILAGLAWALVKVRKGSEIEIKLAAVILIVLLGISYSSFVQPRYLMPLLFWLAMPLVRFTAYRRLAIGACIVGPLFFSALGHLPPRAVATTDVPWLWIWR